MIYCRYVYIFMYVYIHLFMYTYIHTFLPYNSKWVKYLTTRRGLVVVPLRQHIMRHLRSRRRCGCRVGLTPVGPPRICWNHWKIEPLTLSGHSNFILQLRLRRSFCPKKTQLGWKFYSRVVVFFWLIMAVLETKDSDWVVFWVSDLGERMMKNIQERFIVKTHQVVVSKIFGFFSKSPNYHFQLGSVGGKSPIFPISSWMSDFPPTGNDDFPRN